VDSNDKKDRGSQRQNCDLWPIYHTDYYGVSRARVVLNMGSICLFSSVYCSIYAEVCYARLYAYLHFVVLIIKYAQLLYIPRIILGRRRHPHIALFILHPGARRRDTVARQPILTNDQQRWTLRLPRCDTYSYLLDIKQ